MNLVREIEYESRYRVSTGERSAQDGVSRFEGGDAGGGGGRQGGGDGVAEGAAGFAVVDEGLGEGTDEVAGVDAGEVDGAGLQRRWLGPAGDGVQERGLFGPQCGELLEAEGAGGARGECSARGGEAEPGEPHAGEEGSHRRARGVLPRAAELVEAERG